MAESKPSRLLLLGAPEARPEGLERMLVRAGFAVLDAETAADGPPHVILLGATPNDPSLIERVRDMVKNPRHDGASIVVLLTGGTALHTAALLSAGATDVIRAPIDLTEVEARLASDRRRRATLSSARRALRTREALFDIFQEVSGALRPEQVFETLVRRVGEAFGLTHCSFVLTGPGGAQGRVVAVYEDPKVRDLKVHLDRYPEIQEALKTRAPVVVSDVHQHPLFAAIRRHWEEQRIDVKVRSSAALPVFVNGRAAGVFFLRTERGEPELDPTDVDFANTIAQAAARVLENEERRSAMFRRQVSAGTTDALTGCGSLDALDQRLREEFERARRYTLAFSLVLLDIDALRTINETSGQTVGDEVLFDLGAMLQREIRAPDFVARYGGDEFALILPGTALAGARGFVERIRRVVDAHTFPHLGPVRSPSLTAGLVTFPHPDAFEPKDLIRLLEESLAVGKKAPDRIGSTS
ncbi:MAG TPA: diguanylate cyclase [Gemmatimonadales bacterium]|nr:diguanylate cyclase [Gemmatimonadales bacterium]